jgi:hypothetical protein
MFINRAPSNRLLFGSGLDLLLIRLMTLSTLVPTPNKREYPNLVLLSWPVLISLPAIGAGEIAAGMLKIRCTSEHSGGWSYRERLMINRRLRY